MFFLYFIIFDLFNHGNSFGKTIFSIKVVNIENLKNVEVKTLILRTILKMLSTILLPFSIITYLYNGFTLHEKFSKTKTIQSFKK